jgi:hypothetical protein
MLKLHSAMTVMSNIAGVTPKSYPNGYPRDGVIARRALDAGLFPEYPC